MTVTDTTAELAVVTDVQGTEHRKPRVPRRERHRAPRVRGSQPLSPATVTMLWVLVALSVLAVWFVSYGLVFSSVQQAASQRELFAEFREELALATAPIGGNITPGSPIVLMDAPGIGVSNEVVVEGTSSSVMRLGIGHRRDTPLPGQPGVSVLYGRSVTFGAPFAKVPLAIPGQIMTLTTGQGEFEFEVDGLRRPGDPLPQPLAEGESRLTLVATESSGRLEALTASSMVYVDATLVGKSVDAPVGRPVLIAEDESVLVGDRSALTPLVLWLQALLLAMVALAWMRVRWGVWQTWVVGVPIVVGLVWGATSSVYVLLPNLL